MGQVESVVGGITGMGQDYARELMPKGMMWTLLDILPQAVGSNARSRNGWEIEAPITTGYVPLGGIFLEMTGGPRIYYVGGHSSGSPQRLFDNDGVDRGAAVPILQNPFAHRQTFIMPNGLGNAVAKIVSDPGGVLTINDLPAASFPGKYGCAYKDRVVLACSLANPNRVQFGPIGPPTSTTEPNTWRPESYIDATLPIKGIGVLKNSIMVYHGDSVERIRGDTPPNTTLPDVTGNMVVEAFPTRVGLFDARSISYWRDHIIWVDERGVHMTDGAATTNLAEAGGMEIPWRSLFALQPAYATGAVVGDFYIITMLLQEPVSYTYLGAAPATPHVPDYPGGVGEQFITFLIDIPSRTWTRLSNFPATCYVVSKLSADEDLFMGHLASHIIHATDAIYPTYQSALTGTDAPGYGAGEYHFRPIIETPWFPLEEGRDRIHNVIISYELRSEANATVIVEAGLNLSADPPTFEYITLPKRLPTHTTMRRIKIPVRKEAEGIALRLTVDGAFSLFNLFSVELETHARAKVSLAHHAA